eukprot:5512470-Pyramimonas_sp.AAC.1
MKCKDMYKVGDATSLAPMALERLKIMKGDTTPKDALGLVGGDAQELLRDPGRFTERPPDHYDSRGVPPRPYMDPGLRGNSPVLRELVSRLHSCGLVVHRRRVKSFIGLFAVLKKDG